MEEKLSLRLLKMVFSGSERLIEKFVIMVYLASGTG
jgi:hypothetical protein